MSKTKKKESYQDYKNRTAKCGLCKYDKQLYVNGFQGETYCSYILDEGQMAHCNSSTGYQRYERRAIQ